MAEEAKGTGETPDPRDYVAGGAVLVGVSRQGRDLAPECIEL
jgi:hypothetical protein